MPQRNANSHIKLSQLLTLLAFFIASSGGQSIAIADTSKNLHDGIFLVATEQLHHSSFRHAVILLTHYSERGATGLTINRPSGVQLQQAFPEVRQLQQNTDPLYLGGPVNTNAIFVLLRTRTPSKRMHHIANDVYFSTAENAFSQTLNPSTSTRTFAGYAGWAAGQLQNEINRGDWLMVHTSPKIIFEKDTDTLWQRLSKQWKGKWI
jgi:putative transcriptional regulator